MSEITDRICRACLEPSTKTYPLVGNILNVDVNIAKMLEYCTTKKLDLSDSLPQEVCLSCFKTIRLAYNFLKQFQESQEKLYELLNVCKEQDEHEAKCERTASNSSNQYDLQNVHDYSLESQIKNECDIEDLDATEKTQNGNSSEEGYSEMYENECDGIEDVEKKHSTQSNVEEAISDIRYLEGFDPAIFEFKYVEDESDMPVKVESDNSNYNAVGVGQTFEISSEVGSVQTETVIQLVKDPFLSVVYKCPICPEKIYEYRKFQQHVLSHGLDNVVCTRCTPNVELFVEEYFSHYRKLHKFQCDICNKRLSSGYGYLYHMKHHEDIKEHKCPYEGCEKSYFLSNLLEKHMLLHTKSSVHPCDLCGATFRSIGAFKYHKKTHEGDRNHLCIHCGKAFYQAVHLKDHINRHMGHKAFTCDICGKSFITNSQLKKHIKLCTRKNRKIAET